MKAPTLNTQQVKDAALDPRKTNLGAVGVALVKAAKS